MFKSGFIILAMQFCFSLYAYTQVSNYKIDVSQTVFRDIIQSYGVNISPPELRIRSKSLQGKKQVIMYYPGEKPLIIMDEDIYDLCASFGKDSLNALASLLGHELAHHFEKHNWCSSFAYLLGDDNELIKSIKKTDKDDRLRIESEADFYGGFYGYVAGYSTYEITPKLLDAIYSGYKLPDKIPGYPSKADRKAISIKRLDELKSWTMVFDAAEFLFSLREYKKAIPCFDFLTEKFPSRENFNNSGVCNLLLALEYFDAKEIPFMLPVEFDNQSRLRSGSVRSVGIDPQEKQKIRNLLLDNAIAQFDKAILRDPGYIIAKINRACAYYLKKNYDMVIGISNDLLNNNTSSAYNLANAHTLRAIALRAKNNNDEAIKDFEKAKALNSNSITNFNFGASKELSKGVWDSFVDYIYSYFDEEELKMNNPEKGINPAFERIENKNPVDNNIGSSNSVIIAGNPSIEIKFLSTALSNSIVYDDKDEQLNILYTKTGYSNKTSQGISIGSKGDLVKSKYGEPTYTLRAVRGEYWIYKKSRIIFLFNDRNGIEKWIIYYKN